MSKRNRQKQGQNSNRNGQRREFKIELLNSAQKLAWAAFQKHDVLFFKFVIFLSMILMSPYSISLFSKIFFI